MSNLTNILNNFDNESINVKDFIQAVRDHEYDHFGLDFSLNDLVDIAEAQGVELSLSEAKEVATVIERRVNCNDGISWTTLHAHLETFVRGDTRLKNISKAFVLVFKDTLVKSFQEALGVVGVNTSLKNNLINGVIPERAIYLALKPLTVVVIKKVSDFTNSKLDTLRT